MRIYVYSTYTCMWVYICVRACGCICVYIYVYLCICAYRQEYIIKYNTSQYKNTFACEPALRLQMCIHTHVLIHAYIRIPTHAYPYVCIYTANACLHIYIYRYYIHIPTYICIQHTHT